MPEIEIDIEFFCGRCGAHMCQNATAGKTTGRRQPFFTIEPCEMCLERERQTGYDNGYDEGVASK
jgi:hypothetical protein